MSIYIHASRLWGNLKQYDGMHWNSLPNGLALSYNWKTYHRLCGTIPALNHRFKRCIFTDDTNELFYLERLNLLKVMHFYMHGISEALIEFKDCKIDTTMELASLANFQDTKRLDNECVLVHKY